MARLITAALLIVLACRGAETAPAEDKSAPGRSADASLNDLFSLPSWLNAGVEYRLRYETLDNRYRAGEQGSDQQLAHRTHLRLELRRVLDPLRFVVEFEDSRAQLTDSGSYVNATHVRELSVLQLHAKLVSESLFGRGLHSELQFGRLTMDLGHRRLVARNVFRNTINRFDGLRWAVGAPNKWDLQTFLVRPVTYGSPNLNHGRRLGYFWGLYYQNRTHARLKYDLYYLHLYDDPTMVKGSLSDLKTFGARLYRTPENGGWSYEYETALQFGHVGQLEDLAHLQNVEAGYRWSRLWKPAVLFQYTYASGDSDPADNRYGGFLTLFGARRFELAPTGIYALFARSNLSSPGYRFLLHPLKPLELTFIHRVFRLAQSRDDWRGTGRKDATGQSGSRIGNHLEAVARWKFNRNFAVEAGYAHFFPGAFVQSTVSGNGTRGANYFYVMDELRF